MVWPSCVSLDSGLVPWLAALMRAADHVEEILEFLDVSAWPLVVGFNPVALALGEPTAARLHVAVPTWTLRPLSWVQQLRGDRAVYRRGSTTHDGFRGCKRREYRAFDPKDAPLHRL